jgi:hypothetical protein
VSREKPYPKSVGSLLSRLDEVSFLDAHFYPRVCLIKTLGYVQVVDLSIVDPSYAGKSVPRSTLMLSMACLRRSAR